MIPDILSALSQGTEAISRINAWRNGLKGEGALLIEELKDNLIHLDMVAKGEAELRKVIDGLSIAQYRTLLGKDFAFNSLKRKRIADYESLHRTELASWSGKTTEELIKTIYEKINDLKLRYKNADESANYHWGRRIQSIRKRIWLLLKHIET